MNFTLHAFYLSKPDFYKSLHFNHLGWILVEPLTSTVPWPPAPGRSSWASTHSGWVAPHLSRPPSGTRSFQDGSSWSPSAATCGTPLTLWLEPGPLHHCLLPSSCSLAGPASLLSSEFSRTKAGTVPSAHFYFKEPGNTHQASPRNAATRDCLADCTQCAKPGNAVPISLCQAPWWLKKSADTTSCGLRDSCPHSPPGGDGTAPLKSVAWPPSPQLSTVCWLVPLG